jgi:hypothetical protein
MMKEFNDLLKKGKPLSAEEAKAKASSLKDLMGQIRSGLGKDIAGLKKVTVAADSKEGLKEGLEKAESLLGDEDESEESDEKLAEDKEESSETPAKSEEEKIADLEKQLQELKDKKRGKDVEGAKESLKSIF